MALNANRGLQLSNQASRGDLRALGTVLRETTALLHYGNGSGEIPITTNLAVGTSALLANTTGANNTAIGHDALDANTVGTANTAVGKSALSANTTGVNNVAVGKDALLVATVGVRNIAVGNNAMGLLTTGTDNVAIGSGALEAATTAVENIAIGTDALKVCTVGINNIAIGDDAMLACTTANACVAIGRDALVAVTTGINNIAIGDTAGNTITTGSGNTIVGQAAQASAVGAVDQIVLGRGVTGVADNAITLGDVTRAITCNFDADQTWDAPSDMRMKNWQGDSKLGLDFVRALTPREYTFKPTSEWPAEWGVPADAPVNTDTHLGMFAQDVKAALDKVGVKVFGGWTELPNGQQQLGESAFVYPLINAVKELAAKVDRLQHA